MKKETVMLIELSRDEVAFLIECMNQADEIEELTENEHMLRDRLMELGQFRS